MSEEIKSKQNKKKKSPITLVADPFGFKTTEVSQAQNNDSEQLLDEVIEDDEDDIDADEELALEAAEKADETLSRIADAITEQTETDMAQALAAEDSPQEIAVHAAEELARQIAEDQALQAQMAKEAQQAEEDLASDPELQAALPEGTDLEEVQSCIEALLFLSDKPISLNKLREHLSPAAAPDSEEKPELIPLNVLQEALTALKDRFTKSAHGIELMEINGGYQFRTKPIRAPLVKKLSKVQTQRLSSGAMETLAIVAYRQPVMKEEVDKVRGVDSSYFVRGLLDRKLIKISGRSELPGRPMLYSTSDEFLEVFGLNNLDALPPLRELEQMVPTSESGRPQDEDPRVKHLREMVSQMNSDKSTSLIYDPREDEKILKEIKDRVSAIPTSVPSLDEQKAAEKAAAVAAAAPAVSEEAPALEVAPAIIEIPEAPATPEEPAAGL